VAFIMNKALLALTCFGIVGCAGTIDDQLCSDDDGAPIACEPLEDVPEMPDEADPPESLAEIGGVDLPGDQTPGPDDLDGMADEAREVRLDQLPAGDEMLLEAGKMAGSVAIDPGRTKKAELRKLLPIGRTAGTRRYVIMRLKPSDLPKLAVGDVVRAAAEMQVTTRCDIGQVAPGCGYSPGVRMQLVLAGDGNATDPSGAGVLALSDVHGFSCNSNEHHCVEAINFPKATKELTQANSPPCVANGSCFINLVVWAYDSQARSGGADKLIIGANEGNFLDNNNSEQDRGRIMMVRERGISPGDRALRVTDHDVKKGSIDIASNGDWKRIYSHTLKGGNDLKAGEVYRVWAEVDATSNHRVNLSLLFFLTKNRDDRNGGAIDGVSPKAISEHNGTNCSPGSPCKLPKVALFKVDHDIAGPVFVNVTASAEVPGPGAATVTIRDTGFVKSLRYSAP
jgi:hypothetical protein